MSCASTLKGKGFKLTPQRRLILDIIHGSGGHLTAEEILDYVQGRVPGINRSTVYRTLELLEGLGCVYRSEAGGRSIYHHAEEGHHHHLVCRRCGRSLDCGEDLFSPVEKNLRENYGFGTDFRHMVINGICRDCAGE